MKIKSKIFVFMAILAVLSAPLLCCGDGGANTQNGGGREDAGGNIREDAATDANLRENTPDSLPDNLNFDNTEIRILHRAENEVGGELHMWSDEIMVEGEIGEIVNDALYHRNKNVEERLNVKIVPVPIPGYWTERDSFLKTVRTSVNSGSDDYDMIAGYAYYITTLAPEGILHNWKNVPYINPEAEWWSADLARQLTIDGKLYYITGDMAITLLRNMFVIYFNKQLAQDCGIENPYQIVQNGDFTLDKIEQLTKGIYKDVNGDGKPDKADVYGYATTTGKFVDAFFNAFDQPVVKKDESGMPQLTLNTPKMTAIVDKVYSFFYENENIYAVTEYVPENIEDIYAMFDENRVLFMPGTLAVSDRLRAMNGDYGIIPYPKWDKDQPDYYTASQNSYSLFCIPVTCSKIDAVGAAAEAMCAESYRKVTPAYYEIALKKKYSRDDETSQMLDLIRSGLTFDFGIINSVNVLDIQHIFRELMTDRKTDFISRYEKSERAWQKALDKLLDKYQDLP